MAANLPELVAMSAARALTVALKGRWHGTYGMASCPVHADRTPSLQISDGDDGETHFHCHASCDWRDVRDALRAVGLLPEFAPNQHAPRQPRRLQLINIGPDPEAIKRTAEAREIWRAALPITPDTPVWRYLTGRAIDPGKIGGIPATLRYSPGLEHELSGLYLPALVAAVTVWPERSICAVHRTYLKADGSAKAPSVEPRLAKGPIKNGAVRLAQVTDELVVGEGIETTLSAQQITGKPAWAAISTGGLVGLRLPDLPLAAHVIIAADNDEAGQQAAEQAAVKWIHEGRTVEIATPPQLGSDWNDVLQKGTSWAA